MRYAENETTRLTAIWELLDRDLGRAPSYTSIKSEVQTTPRSVREISNEELMEITERGRADRESGED